MFNTRQIIILIAASLALAQNLDFDLDCTNALGPCNNICFAVNCKGSAYKLNYDSNAANRGPRRTASGCNRSPCTNTHYKSFGSSCDEFPFASTTQGGKGAILRCVDSSENSSEEGQLRNYYKGIRNGHQFGIVISNFAEAAFCNNASNCNNDGGEFRLVNGNFVNARRTDEDFVPAASDTNTRTPFRKFMGSDGQERLWVATNTTGNTLVGKHVWNGVGEKVLITSEIPHV